MSGHGGFRADIQGLRALAVALVVLDHADVGPFDSGFVGVDVFFVISGFLITGLLVREAEGTGTISLATFYARRALRILPAATLVLLVVLLLAWATLSGTEAVEVAGDAGWTALFLANVKFGNDGTDYFSQETLPSPLQHYWSLSIEEQFYLLWPVLILVLLLAGRARPERLPRRLLVLALVTIIVASYAASVLMTGNDPVGSYFSTLTRFWEAGVGALLAVLAPAARAGRIRDVLSVAGLAMVLVSAVLLDPVSFPGWVAAVPVAGACLLLVGGSGGGHGPVQRLLAVRPVRAVGDWSYSLYLWHWPVLILAARWWRRPEGWWGVVAIAVALAVSAVSYRWVEGPFRSRRARQQPARRTLALYPVLVGGICLAALATSALVQSGFRTDNPPITVASYGQGTGSDAVDFSADPAEALVEASALATRTGFPVPGHLRPDVFELGANRPDVRGCNYGDWPRTVLCRRGDTDAGRTVVLVGDSHARAWVPALERAARESGWAAYYLVKTGCPAGDLVRTFPMPNEPDSLCVDFRTWVDQQVAELRPELLVVASSTPPVITLPDGRHASAARQQAPEIERALVARLERLRDHAGRTVLLGDVPGVPHRPGKCLTSSDGTLASCAGRPNDRSRRLSAATRSAARASGVDYLDVRRWFCAYDVCPLVIGDYLAYRDKEHVSIEYAEALAEPLGRALRMFG